MNLSSLSSQFIFNLPADFLQAEVVGKYEKLLKKNHIPYDNVLDYINSTIKEIAFPSIAFETPEQVIKRGKRITWKSSQNVFDTFVKELDITFKSVNSHLNYFLLYDIIINHYLDIEHTYNAPLSITILDKHGDAIFQIIFKSVNIRSLSEMRLNYAEQTVDEKLFTLSFVYNFLEIGYVLTEQDIISRDDSTLFNA